MNSFFMDKLMRVEYSLSSDGKRWGKDAHVQSLYEFKQVQKWTKKTDIFELDNIFIPINQSNSH